MIFRMIGGVLRVEVTSEMHKFFRSVAGSWYILTGQASHNPPLVIQLVFHIILINDLTVKIPVLHVLYSI